MGVKFSHVSAALAPGSILLLLGFYSSSVSPLVASFMVLLPPPCWLRPLLLLACTATVALFPHFFTSHPACTWVGCHSSSFSPRVTWPPSTSPKPSVPSLCLYVLHSVSSGAVAPTAGRDAFSVLHRGGKWASEKWRNWTMVTLLNNSRCRTHTHVLAPSPVCRSTQAYNRVPSSLSYVCDACDTCVVVKLN